MRVSFKIDNDEYVTIKCNSVQQAHHYIDKYHQMFEPEFITIYFKEFEEK